MFSKNSMKYIKIIWISTLSSRSIWKGSNLKNEEINVTSIISKSLDNYSRWFSLRNWQRYVIIPMWLTTRRINESDMRDHYVWYSKYNYGRNVYVVFDCYKMEFVENTPLKIAKIKANSQKCWGRNCLKIKFLHVKRKMMQTDWSWKSN